MPCTSRRITVNQKTTQQVALEKLEQELAQGVATLQTDMFGNVTIVGGVRPDGMEDLCILASLEQRNTLEFQLAKQAANVEATNFVGLHDAAHAILGKAGH